jgi:hypothetical protein
MNWLTHLFTNLIIAIPLKYLFNLELNLIIIFILWSILIDIDHIFLFIFKYKTLNLKKIWKISKKLREKMQAELYLFHSPEFNIILLILSVFNKLALIIFISNLIHISLDTMEHYKAHRNFKWFKKWSIIYSIIKTEEKPL